MVSNETLAAPTPTSICRMAKLTTQTTNETTAIATRNNSGRLAAWSRSGQRLRDVLVIDNRIRHAGRLPDSREGNGAATSRAC